MVFRPAGKPKRQTFTHTCPFPCSLSCSTSFFLCHCLSHCYDATSLHFERCNVVFSRTAVYAVHECTEMHCRCARTQILFTERGFFLSFSSSFEAIFSARRRREYKEACWGLLVVVGKFHFLLRPCHAMRVICVLHGPFSYGGVLFLSLGLSLFSGSKNPS